MERRKHAARLKPRINNSNTQKKRDEKICNNRAYNITKKSRESDKRAVSERVYPCKINNPRKTYVKELIMSFSINIKLKENYFS